MLTIYFDKCQFQLNLSGNSTIPLPNTILLESITCHTNKEAVPFHVLPKNNILVLDYNKEVQCNYLCKGIYWKCIGDLQIRKDKMILAINGRITNQDEKTTTANVMLLTGRQRSAAKPRMMKLVAQESALTNEPEESVAEDYVLYDIGKLTLESDSITSVPLTRFQFLYKKVYIIQAGNNSVNYGYRIIANDYIPECIVNVSMNNIHLGSSHLKEARKGNDRLIIVGNSSKVKCENTVQYFEHEDQERIDKHTIKSYNTEVITCKMETADPVTIILSHPLRNTNIVSISTEPTRIRSGIAEWEFEVDGEELFECELVYYETIYEK